jgi:hypothetical protein
MALSQTQTAALSALTTEPLTLSTEWATNGERRQLFFFANAATKESGVRIRISDIATLSAFGLVEMIDDPKDPESLTIKATARGLAEAGKLKDAA